MSDFAPVVISVYRRAGHLRKTLESLVRCEGFCAEPRNRLWGWSGNAEEMAAVGEAQSTVEDFLGDRAEYHFGEINRRRPGVKHFLRSRLTLA